MVVSLPRRSWLLLISVWFASAGESQKPLPVSRLDKPLAEFPEGFTSLTAVRELPDGRVMLLERCESIVVLLDFTGRRFTQVARTGAGPGEYVRAAALWALPGDSSAIYDRANLRFLVIDPTGKPERLFPAPQSLATRVGRFAVEAPFTVRGTDGRGHADTDAGRQTPFAERHIPYVAIVDGPGIKKECETHPPREQR